MSIRSLTYQQSVLKRYHSDKHFSEFLPTRWRQKSTGIDMEQNYVTITLCVHPGYTGRRTHNGRDCLLLVESWPLKSSATKKHSAVAVMSYRISAGMSARGKYHRGLRIYETLAMVWCALAFGGQHVLRCKSAYYAVFICTYKTYNAASDNILK